MEPLINYQKKILFFIPLLCLMIFTISGCEIIDGIFKTGVGIGAFVVLVIVILIFALSRRFRR